MKKDGTPVNGTIVGYSDGQIMVQTRTSTGGIAKFPTFQADVKSITMATPDAVAKAEAPGTPPGQVIAALEGPVKAFAGLNTAWVIRALGELGDAYSQVGQVDKALAVYNEIGQLYPGSVYENIAKASRAEVSFNQGKVDEALATVQPIVDAANKDLAPSPTDGEAYAKAFLVYGRVLESRKQFPQALEAYLTVTTMFYQNPSLVAEADHYAKDLRTKNPGLGVE